MSSKKFVVQPQPEEDCRHCEHGTYESVTGFGDHISKVRKPCPYCYGTGKVPKLSEHVPNTKRMRV